MPTRLPTARKIAGVLKIMTDLIVFLYSFFFLMGSFVYRDQYINTTDSIDLHNISLNIVGLHCMPSTIPPKHRYVIADFRKYEEMLECLIFIKMWLKQQES